MKIDKERGFTFFFTENDALSNWYLRDFVVKGKTFNCMESFMMFSKAMLFKDQQVADEILTITGKDCQKRQKAAGRKVSGFVEEIWLAKREDIVTAGLIHKFTQHPDLKAILLSTKGTILVEASPYDGIWGVKMGQNDPNIYFPERWRGQNLLGKCLTRARDFIIKRDNELSTGLAM